MTDFLITAPLHEETRGKIGTTQMKSGNWVAWRDNDGNLIGFGATKEDAISDLLELERR